MTYTSSPINVLPQKHEIFALLSQKESQHPQRSLITKLYYLIGISVAAVLMLGSLFFGNHISSKRPGTECKACGGHSANCSVCGHHRHGHHK